MRIPLGNFGSVVPASVSTRVVPQAFDTGGDALVRTAATLGDVATAQFTEDQRAAEKAKQEAEALNRVKAANLVLDREIAAKQIAGDIGQELETGQLSHDKAGAEYRRRLGELPAPTLEGMDPVTAENFSKGIKRAEFGTQSSVDAHVRRAFVADQRATVDSMIDKLGKLPAGDVATANAQLDALDDAGAKAYGAGWGKRKQDAKDANWNTHVAALVSSARDDPKALAAIEQRLTIGDLSDKLDGPRRNQQEARIVMFKTAAMQRAEAAAARADRQAEQRMRQAGAEYATFQALSDKGAMLDPAYVDRVAQMTAGTPYQAGVKALAAQAQASQSIAMQPIATQRAALDAIDRQIATTGRTPELDKRREQVAKVVSASESDLKNDAMRAGAERGIIQGLAPLDTSTPEAFAATVAKRLDQAGVVSSWAGKQVSPLNADESEAMRQMLDALPTKAKSTAIATIAASVGEKAAQAMAGQLDGKNKALAAAFGAAADKTDRGRFVSELILKGEQALKDGRIKVDGAKVTGWKAEISKAVEGVFLDERQAQAVKDAAYYASAGIAAEDGGGMLSDGDPERAIRLVLGGNLIEHNGGTIPTPGRMSRGEFAERLRNVPESAITAQAPGGKVKAGGVEIPADVFFRSLPGQTLAPIDRGRYAVMVNGRPVTNTAGKAILIEVK